jgi:hypothetical protein
MRAFRNIGRVLQPADLLVAFPFGLEKNAARGLIKRGELPARKLGRRWYAKRSDVLGLIDSAPAHAQVQGTNLTDDLAAIAERTRGAR